MIKDTSVQYVIMLLISNTYSKQFLCQVVEFISLAMSVPSYCFNSLHLIYGQTLQDWH